MIEDLIIARTVAINDWLNKFLPDCDNPLIKAMRYSLLNDGKRIRPFLVAEISACYGGNMDNAYILGCVLEMVHSYSLIHDDLPALDNDDMRRGVPSCHKKFGEATAILAGSGLLTLAFEIITNESLTIKSEDKLFVIQQLSKAIGCSGMLLGQEKDLLYAAQGEKISQNDVLKMYELKTGCLFGISILFGGVAAGCNGEVLAMLRDFGMKMGIFFQLRDDIKDFVEEKTYNNIAMNIGMEQARVLMGSCQDELLQATAAIPNSKNLYALLQMLKDLQ